MIYPDEFDQKTGFDSIRGMLNGLCLCSLGRQHVEKLSFLTSYNDIKLRLQQTDEFRRILVFSGEFPLGHISDATPWLKKLRVEGTFIELNELFDLKRSLDTARVVINWFSGKNADSYPALTDLSSAVGVPSFIRDRLSSLLTKEGAMKDNASPELLSLRRDIRSKHALVSKKIQAIMKSVQDGGLADPDAGVAVRDGRLVIPVNASMKRKIKGIIHDESASGKTAYVEPSELVELNNDIRELEYAEKREVIRILREFAGLLRPYLDELFGVFRYMGLIDFIRAKALLSVKVGGVMPVLNDAPVVEWKNAVHPLLYLSLSKVDRETVPLDIELNETNRILLISGPNAGGKSVCLQTIGLLQYMLQCGLLVPMSENSEAGIFSGIFIDIGDEQSIENDLSTYSSHLINMKFFIRHSTPRSLILIDEFGSGTEPVLGGSIAEAILERLNKNRTYGVITTHYTNLKHFAASTEGLMNGAMMFDTGKMKPLFRLECGKPGSSFAFEIARKIGLPEEILQSAVSRMGEDHIDFDRHLKDVIRDKHYWERKRRNIRKLEKKLEEDIERYGSQLAESKKEKKEIIAEAREEARQLLADVNKRIENTIREIRESQAEKERTKKARKKLDMFKSDVDKGNSTPETGPAAKTEDKTIRKHDYVRLFDRDMAGEVLDVNGTSIMVAFGNMITTVKESKLEKLSPSESKRLQKSQVSSGISSAFNIRDKKLNFRSERDVRGMRADEALDVITTFIDDALIVGAGEVRILHGKGNGILRQMIRDYLATVPPVKSFRDEHPESGGAGITVVLLES